MKTAKKGICLALALLLCMGLLAACGGNGDDNGYNNGDDASVLSGEMLAGIDAKAVVIEIDGMPVLWEEFFYDLQSLRHMLETQGPVMDWDAVFEGQPLYPGEVTFNEFAILYATDRALERRSIEVLYTDELGERLEADFYEEIRAEFLTSQGMDEEEFEAFLEEYFLTEDVFRYINETMAMQERAMADLAGMEGELVSDAAVAAYVEMAGILSAKHILISVLDEDRQPLPEEEQEEANARAYALFEELEALEGEEQLARFEGMMADYGEDPGMEMSPEGYTFFPAAMVPEFSEGTMALEIGEIGPPVRSDFGYHIILRLQVERDAMAMPGGTGQPLPVQLLAAGGELEQRMAAIRDSMNYTRTPLLDTIVPGEIFAHGDGWPEDEMDDEIDD